jgi:hypothetical protein
MTSYKGISEFPVCLWSVADEIGVLREKNNEGRYEQHPEYKRGDARSRNQVDVLGVLGELVARHHLCQRGDNFTAAPLLAARPEIAPDIVCRGNRIDVKAYPRYARHLLVNEGAHHKIEKGVDYYWFLRILNQHEAEHYWAPFGEVSSWPCKSFGYAPAFYHRIPDAEHREEVA